MRLSLLLIVSLSVFWSCTTNGSTPPETIVEDGQSLLWRIDGNNLSTPSYIYGTIHLISRDDFHFGQQLKHTLVNADKIAFEIELDQSAMMKAAMGMFFKGDTVIGDFLTPAQMDTLSAFFQDTLGVSAMEWMSYQKMKPFALSQLYLTSMLGEAPLSFELEFKTIADSLGIPILGLESVEDQLAVIDGMPMERQIDMVMSSVHEYGTAAEDFGQLVDYYKRQEIDSLYQLMSVDYDEIMEFSDSFLDQRNQNWIPVIESLIAEGSVFIAVGAGHLPGDQGVIQLLKEAGYTLTPIATE